ncbi:MAG: hypothetical protein U9N35_00760 [Euryarchaeota archaeon]|nr:hypothetical protein [Euryarchaeota archaeon]
MESIEDIFIRKTYKGNKKNLLEVDMFSTNSYGKSTVVTGENINDIIEVVLPELIGFSVLEQKPVDYILEEITTSPEVRFAFSIAAAKAASNFYGMPLYQYAGGIFISKLPRVVYKNKVYDHKMNQMDETVDPKPISLDTLFRIKTEQQGGGNTITPVEAGICHLAVGFNIKYLKIKNKSEINELLRIYEDLSRMEEI